MARIELVGTLIAVVCLCCSAPRTRSAVSLVPPAFDLALGDVCDPGCLDRLNSVDPESDVPHTSEWELFEAEVADGKIVALSFTSREPPDGSDWESLRSACEKRFGREVAAAACQDDVDALVGVSPLAGIMKSRAEGVACHLPQPGVLVTCAFVVRSAPAASEQVLGGSAGASLWWIVRQVP